MLYLSVLYLSDVQSEQGHLSRFQPASSVLFNTHLQYLAITVPEHVSLDCFPNVLYLTVELSFINEPGANGLSLSETSLKS